MSDYASLKKYLDEHKVDLLAVSKTHSNDEIRRIYQLGQRDFGENRVYELISKAESLPKDIRWHQIGPLQSNKIKNLIPYVELIHSGTRKKVFKYVDKYAGEMNKVVDMLIQIHIAQEDTKSGFEENELREMIKSGFFDELRHVRIRGLMGMATFTDNEQQIRQEFRSLHTLFNELKSNHFLNDSFDTLSMGMSGDYKIAIEEGATIVRIGSLIFGSRNYK